MEVDCNRPLSTAVDGNRQQSKKRKQAMKNATLLAMACAFLAMLLIDIFALHVSSITLMLIAAVISLAIFLTRRNTGKAGAAL